MSGPSSSEDAKRRAAYVPFALGGGALAIGLGLAAWGSMPRDDVTEGSSGPSSTAEVTSATATAEQAAGGAPPADEVTYEPDLSGDDIGRKLTSSGASAHGLAVIGERVVWIETDEARVASMPLAGGEVTVLSSVADEDRYGGGFVAGDDGVFWSVGDVGGAPDPIYFVTAKDLTLARPALSPLATTGSVDELALAGDLFVADGGRLVKVDDEEQTLIAERPGRVAALVGCAGTLWWLEAPLSGRGEHALMTLDDERAARRAKLDEAERGPMTCGSGRVIWAEDRPDGTHRLARLEGDATVPLAATGTVTALTASGPTLYWAEVHGEGASAVSLLRRMDGDAAERIGRDRGTTTALVVAGERLVWATDDGLQVHSPGG